MFFPSCLVNNFSPRQRSRERWSHFGEDILQMALQKNSPPRCCFFGEVFLQPPRKINGTFRKITTESMVSCKIQRHKQSHSSDGWRLSHHLVTRTPPKTNISPENSWLKDDSFPFKSHLIFWKTHLHSWLVFRVSWCHGWCDPSGRTERCQAGAPCVVGGSWKKEVSFVSTKTMGSTISTNRYDGYGVLPKTLLRSLRITKVGKIRWNERKTMVYIIGKLRVPTPPMPP